MIASSFWTHRDLIWQMTRREVIGRYRGSIMGVLWSFLHPLFMLAIYTFVFSIIFQARWTVHSTNKVEFAMILFAGLIPYSFFAECFNRAPSLILTNVNYVKKVVFPLEILAWVTTGAALFHMLASLCVLLIFVGLVTHTVHWTLIFWPLVNVPFLLLMVGVVWFLSYLGVLFRDVGQTVGLLASALLFLSPVFYPITQLPEMYRPFLYLNPLTFVIEQNRNILLFGQPPDWQGLGIYTLCSLLIFGLGFAWFQKSRRAFADVL